jgi:hypothetical protein
VESDGVLLGKTGAKGALIVADARVGPDFEVDAEVEVVSSSNGEFQAGVVFGLEPSLYTDDWSSFRLKRTRGEGEVLYFSRHFNWPTAPVRHAIPERSRVVVQAWQGRLWAYLDGEPVVVAYTPDWALARTPDVQVGFGGYLDDNAVTLRFRNARLRRLTGLPSPPSTSPSR